MLIHLWIASFHLVAATWSQSPDCVHQSITERIVDSPQILTMLNKQIAYLETLIR